MTAIMDVITTYCRQCGATITGSWRRLLCDSCKELNQKKAKAEFWIKNPDYKKKLKPQRKDQAMFSSSKSPARINRIKELSQEFTTQSAAGLKSPFNDLANITGPRKLEQTLKRSCELIHKSKVRDLETSNMSYHLMNGGAI